MNRSICQWVQKSFHIFMFLLFSFSCIPYHSSPHMHTHVDSFSSSHPHKMLHYSMSTPTDCIYTLWRVFFSSLAHSQTFYVAWSDMNHTKSIASSSSPTIRIILFTFIFIARRRKNTRTKKSK